MPLEAELSSGVSVTWRFATLVLRTLRYRKEAKRVIPIRLDSSAVDGVTEWMCGPLSGLPRSFLVFCQRTRDGSALSLVSKDSRAIKRYILRVML